MKLPVVAIVTETLHDLPRFAQRHPLAILLAISCTIPLEYGIALIETTKPDWSALTLFAASLALSTLGLIVWLPLWIVAIREIVTGRAVRMEIAAPSPASLGYAATCFALLAAQMLILSARTVSATGAVVQFAGALVLTWLVLRSTLFVTALALGRRDLGLREAFAGTSSHLLRLLAIVGGLLLVVGALALAAAFALTEALSETEAEFHARVLIGTVTQLLSFAMAISGAHIYRSIGPAAPQNGQY